jgi:bifunctional DNase/RNase
MLSNQMSRSSVEVDIRALRPSVDGAAATIVLGARGQRDGPRITVPVAGSEVHSLLHELQGQETPRSESLGLLEGALASLGGRVVATHLGSEPGGTGFTGWLDLETPAGPHMLAAAPAQAVAAAVRLAVPLLVDQVLFDLTAQRTSLEVAVADVLNHLDH